MQKKRLGQETSARDGYGSPLVGIPSTCQLVPSKRSAIRPLPQLPVAWQNRTTGQSTVERELPGRAIRGKIDQLPKPDAACGHHRGLALGRGGGSDDHADPAAVRTGDVTEPDARGAFGLRRGLQPPGIDTAEPALDQGRGHIGRGRRLADGRASAFQWARDAVQGCLSRTSGVRGGLHLPAGAVPALRKRANVFGSATWPQPRCRPGARSRKRLQARRSRPARLPESTSSNRPRAR